MTDGNGKVNFGGGLYLATALLAGAGIGIYIGQPSAGIMAGLAVGAIAAAMDWLIRRRR